MSSVARRYATAAVEAASESGNAAVEALANGLRAFADLYAESNELRELVKNPALKDARPAVLRDICSKLEATELTQSLILLLTDNERIDIVADVAREVEQAADEILGRNRARVVSAIELDAAQKARLEAALEERLKTPLLLDIDIDPSILGGLIIEVGSHTIDSSIRRQLQLLAERLQADT